MGWIVNLPGLGWVRHETGLDQHCRHFRFAQDHEAGSPHAAIRQAEVLDDGLLNLVGEQDVVRFVTVSRRGFAGLISAVGGRSPSRSKAENLDPADGIVSSRTGVVMQTEEQVGSWRLASAGRSSRSMYLSVLRIRTLFKPALPSRFCTSWPKAACNVFPAASLPGCRGLSRHGRRPTRRC